MRSPLTKTTLLTGLSWLTLFASPSWAAGPAAGGEASPPPLIQSDAVLLGILLVMLGAIFWSSNSQLRFFRLFYSVVPMLLLCYFLPSLLTLAGVVDPSQSNLYFMASRYLLPASLVLLTISVDLKEIAKLGRKALVMFVTGTVGVILGGPLAILIVSAVNPALVGGADSSAVWRGLSTVAGSWIGGGANQAAMKEVFQPSDELFSAMVTVDVLVAEVWMLFILLGVGRNKGLNRWLRADDSSVQQLQNTMEEFAKKTARIPSTADLMAIAAVGFGCTAASHFVADFIAPFIGKHYPNLSAFSLDSSFFWLIIVATTLGLLLSFTSFKNLEGVGASKVGSVFIYILVATIGLGMDLRAVVTYSGLFVVGLIWMSIHVALMVVVAYLIRAPYFFLAVGSKANIGGAASAPIVAAAFHPSLAPVGVLLAVLGYVLGTYGAYLCALLMQMVAPG
jgi:uncharacterized membrane protein